MLNRKVLLAALLAIVLLGSLLDLGVSVNGGRNIKKKRAQAVDQSSVAAVVPSNSSVDLMARSDHRKRRLGTSEGVASLDQNDQALFMARNPRKRHLSAVESAAVLDQANSQSLILAELRRRRVPGGKKL